MIKSQVTQLSCLVITRYLKILFLSPVLIYKEHAQEFADFFLSQKKCCNQCAQHNPKIKKNKNIDIIKLIQSKTMSVCLSL